MPEIQKDIQPSSVAEEIADYINNKFAITWVSPWLVQLFIVFSLQIRDATYAYLMSLKSSLNSAKAKAVREAQKGDVIANQLAELRVATSIAFGTLDSILTIVPIDSVLKEIPEVEDFLQTLSANIPIKIPETALYGVAGIAGFELLEGVVDYKSLKAKIDEIEFRATRALALSEYAQTGSAYLDTQIQKVDVYLDILVTLNTRNI